MNRVWTSSRLEESVGRYGRAGWEGRGPLHRHRNPRPLVHGPRGRHHPAELSDAEREQVLAVRTRRGADKHQARCGRSAGRGRYRPQATSTGARERGQQVNGAPSRRPATTKPELEAMAHRGRTTTKGRARRTRDAPTPRKRPPRRPPRRPRPRSPTPRRHHGPPRDRRPRPSRPNTAPAAARSDDHPTRHGPTPPKRSRHQTRPAPEGDRRRQRRTQPPHNHEHRHRRSTPA